MAISKLKISKRLSRVSGQKGFTLVELLAVLLLLSMVVALVWTTVLTSMRYNLSETNKLKMQEEANLIITNLQNIHRKCDNYMIENRNGGIWMTGCKNNILRDFQINTEENFLISGLPLREIEARTSDSTLMLDLIIGDKTTKSKVTISTAISRYKVKEE